MYNNSRAKRTALYLKKKNQTTPLGLRGPRSNKPQRRRLPCGAACRALLRPQVCEAASPGGLGGRGGGGFQCGPSPPGKTLSTPSPSQLMRLRRGVPSPRPLPRPVLSGAGQYCSEGSYRGSGERSGAGGGHPQRVWGHLMDDSHTPDRTPLRPGEDIGALFSLFPSTISPERKRGAC